MYIIYKHTLIADCPQKGWSYIGLTKQAPNKRWKSGLGYYKPNSIQQSRFYYTIEKYGWDKFTHEILEDCLQTIEEANEREKYWIAFYHTYVGDPECQGYNLTTGGDGSEISEEVGRKISQSKLGHTVSEETREKIRQALKGKPNGRKGIPLSAELKQKLSKAHKGVPLSPEHRKALSEGQKGRIFTDETRLKIASAQIGAKNHMFGKKLSEEAKQKIREANQGHTPWNFGRVGPRNKAVVQLTMDNQYIAEFKSIAEAKRITGFYCISEACHGKKLFAGGYRWLFKEDFDKLKEINDENTIN